MAKRKFKAVTVQTDIAYTWMRTEVEVPGLSIENRILMVMELVECTRGEIIRWIETHVEA